MFPFRLRDDATATPAGLDLEVGERVGGDQPLALGPTERPLHDHGRVPPGTLPVGVGVEPGGEVEWDQVGRLHAAVAVTEPLKIVRVPVERARLVLPLGVLEVEVADLLGGEGVRLDGPGTGHELVELLDGRGAVLPPLGQLDLFAADLDVPPGIELTEPRFRFTHDKSSGCW